MNLSQMTVRTLLTVGFGLMAALILLVGGLAIYDMAQQKDQFHDFVKGINARAHEAQQVRTAVNARAVAARNMVLATQDSERDADNRAERTEQQCRPRVDERELPSARADRSHDPDLAGLLGDERGHRVRDQHER